MENDLVREKIVDSEWRMFQLVNNIGGRAWCQDERQTFYNMRMAQFLCWSDEAAESYLQDLKEAELQRRNLLAEKYLHMMEKTHPEEYEIQKFRLPYISTKQQALANEICGELIAQTVILRRKYPLVSQAGRPLFSTEDTPDSTSVQTYQLGELLTYSERTLQLLKDHLFALKEEGRSLAEEITSLSVCSYGYDSLEEAEAIIAKQKA